MRLISISYASSHPHANREAASSKKKIPQHIKYTISCDGSILGRTREEYKIKRYAVPMKSVAVVHADWNTPIGFPLSHPETVFRFGSKKPRQLNPSGIVHVLPTIHVPWDVGLKLEYVRMSDIFKTLNKSARHCVKQKITFPRFEIPQSLSPFGEIKCQKISQEVKALADSKVCVGVEVEQMNGLAKTLQAIKRFFVRFEGPTRKFSAPIQIQGASQIRSDPIRRPCGSVNRATGYSLRNSFYSRIDE